MTDDLGEPIQSYPLEFSVVAGGGLVEGQQAITKQTNSIGRASVLFQLGNEIGEGNNIVRVTFANNVEPPVTFLITGLEPKVGPAVVKGVVLDENFRAIPNATITLMRDGAQNIVVLTDSKGDFRFNNVEPGRYHLRADGTTSSLPLQRYPVLVYEIDVFEGQENTIGMPIFLPRTQMENNLNIDGVSNQTYVTPAIPGLKVDIAPGTITYPDGSHSGEFIISPVPINVLPMPLPNGWATRLAISIQPAGTEFDPPLPITFPNVDGLPPGSKAAIVSFDHGEGRYIKVGDATVSEDGTEIVSDPGHGIHFGAWHAMVPPKKPPCTNVKCDIVSPGSGSCNLITIGSSTTVQVPGTCLTACIAFPPNGKASASALCEIQNDDELGDPELEVFGQEEISADDGLVYVVAHAFFPSEDDPENPEPVGDGSIIEWTILQGNGTLSQTQTPTTDGVAVITLITSRTAGSTYIVQSKLISYIKDGATNSANLTAATELMTVVPGLPADIEIDQSKSSYQSDGTDTVDFEATIKDAFGNLVADDTAVAWLLDESTTGFLEAETATTNGKAAAQLLAPVVPVNQKVEVSSGLASQTSQLTVTRVNGTLTSSKAQLDITSNETTVITADVNAADDTPVFWSTSNGRIEGDESVSNGSASAILYSSGGMLGSAVVTAVIGDLMLVWQGEFTSSGGLALGLDHPVLVSNASEDGFQTVEWEDGTIRQIAYFAASAVHVKGPANASIAVTITQDKPVEKYGFESAIGDSILGEVSGLVMNIGGAQVDTETKRSGFSSLRLSGVPSLIADDSLIDFSTSLNVSVWVYPAAAESAMILSKGDAWQLEITDSGTVRATINTSAGTFIVNSSDTVPINTWSNIGMQFTLGKLGISLNSNQSHTPAFGVLQENDDSVVVGNGFSGNLDDLTLSLPGSSSGLEITGITNGVLSLNSQGEGTFFIRSTGSDAFGLLGSFDDDKPLSVQAFEIFLQNVEDEVEASKQRVILVSKEAWAAVADPVMSLVGADPETPAGYVTAVIGGYLVIADVGVIIKTLVRAIGWGTDKDPNWLECGLSLLGIFTEFSGPGDALVTATRILVAKLGATALAAILMTRRVKAFFGIGDEILEGEEAFIHVLNESEELRDTYNQVIKNFNSVDEGESTFKSVVNGVEEAGDDFHQAVKSTLDDFGGEVAQKTAKLLGELPDDVLKNLKGFGLFDQASNSLAKILAAGFDPETIKAGILNLTTKGFFSRATYTQADFLIDAGKLSDVPGFGRVLGEFVHQNQTIPTISGHLYELQVGAKFIDEKKSVTFVSKLTVDGSDIDIIADGIYYQLKLTTEALKTSRDVRKWIHRARADGAQAIMYIFPEGVSVSKPIMELFQKHDVTIRIINYR